MNIYLRSFSLILLAALSGCASLPHTTTQRFNSHEVEYAKVVVDGTTPVVFENGLGGRLEYWKEVFPYIAKDNTAFAYNRPGYGDSEATDTSRDGEHVVDELREHLRHNGLQPPYILVGHSLGGLYMQHFIRRYPDEVAALVLVDSTHPHQFKGKGAMENWPAWFRLLLKAWLSAAENNEFAAINTTGEAVLAMRPATGIPVIILSAKEPLKEHSELADDANEKRKDLLRLHPGAEQRWIDSGHGIPLEKPDAVITAIRDAIRLANTQAKTQKNGFHLH